MNWLGILAAFGNMLLSGVSAVIYKSQGEKVKPALIIIINSVISWVAFIILVSAIGDFREMFAIPIYPFLAFVSAAVMGIILGNYFYLISLQLIGVSKAYPITMTYPFLTYLFEILFLGANFSWKKAFGIIIIIVGVILISFSHIKQKITQEPGEQETEKAVGANEEVLASLANDKLPLSTVATEEATSNEAQSKPTIAQRKVFLGTLLAILCSITWASGSTLIKYGLNNTTVGIIPINAARLVFLIPISTGLFFLTKEHKKASKISWKSFGLIALAALLSLFVANILYLVALDLIGTSTPSAITASGPLIATPLSIIFLKEKVDWKIIVGTILTIAGNVLVVLLT